MKKRKKGKKKGKAYFVITLLFMSPTTQHIFYHLFLIEKLVIWF